MRPQSGGRRSAREVDAQPLERALDLADRVDGDARIERGRLELGVAAKQDLDHANIDVLLEQMGGVAVPHWVRRHSLGDTGQARGGGHGAAKLPGGHRVDRVLAGEEPGLRAPRRALTIRATVRAVAAKASRSGPAAPCPARPAASCGGCRYRGHLEVRDLGHPQAGAVGDAERGFVLEARRGFEETRHFLPAQHVTGALRGLFTVVRGRTRSGRSSVTVKKNRSAAMAALMDPGLIGCLAKCN